jgi:hypothetical protein
MQIVGSYYSQTPVYERTNLKPNVKPKSTDYSLVQNAAIIDLSSSQSATAQEISNTGSNQTNSSSVQPNNIDVRNCTFDQFCVVAKKLLDSHQIDHNLYSLMTLDIGRLDPHYKTDGNVNWITEFEKRAQIQSAYGNQTGYEYNKKIVNVLSNLT